MRGYGQTEKRLYNAPVTTKIFTKEYFFSLSFFDGGDWCLLSQNQKDKCSISIIENFIAFSRFIYIGRNLRTTLCLTQGGLCPLILFNVSHSVK